MTEKFPVGLYVGASRMYASNEMELRHLLGRGWRRMYPEPVSERVTDQRVADRFKERPRAMPNMTVTVLMAALALGAAMWGYLLTEVKGFAVNASADVMCPKSIPTESPDIDMDGIRKVIIMMKAACDVAQKVEKP